MRHFLFISALLSLVLASCGSSTSDTAPEYYPFKESKSDNWGLVSTTGKVLIADEFKNKPTAVINGIFCVSTDNGYELYKTSAPSKPFGDTFKSIAPFTGYTTPTVQKGEGIKYIDKDGKVKFELPLEYRSASNFIKGYSIIQKKNDEGRIVADVMDKNFKIYELKDFVVVDILSNDQFLVSDLDEDRYIIDKTGKEIVKFKSDFYTLSPNAKMYVYREDNDYGIKDIKGNIIVRAKYKNLVFLSDKYIRATTEDGDGIINTEGEVIIKNRYHEILAIRDDKFIATRDRKDGYGLLDMSEDRIIKYDYEFLLFDPTSNNLIGQKKGEKGTYILDQKGETIAEYSVFDYQSMIPYALQYSGWNKYEFVQSDYFDVTAFVKSIFTPNSRQNVYDLFGHKGKTAQSVAEELKMDLSPDDIKNNDGHQLLPSFEIKNYEYGNYNCFLGFDKAIEQYEDYSRSYYYPTTRYRYAADSHCNYAQICIDLNYETSRHIQTIEEKFRDVMHNLGFPTSESYSDHDTSYSNNDCRIVVQFKNERDRIYFTIFY